ncbi:unnamed protein product [Effrenium voratum]|nr:unnamed protein product [Effrenium voratum]
MAMAFVSSFTPMRVLRVPAPALAAGRAAMPSMASRGMAVTLALLAVGGARRFQARAMARQSAVVRHANKRKAKSGEPIPIPIMNLFPEFAEDAEETFQDQIPDELKEEVEDELPPKKSLEDSVYCCWVTPKKRASETLKSWSEEEEADDEQRQMLDNLALTQFKSKWTVWCLCHSSEKHGPGFYIMPPQEAEALVVVEAVDKDTNNFQHIAVRPTKMGDDTRQAFLDWIDSLRPKVVVVKRPQELYAFGLGVDGDGAGTEMGSGLSSEGYNGPLFVMELLDSCGCKTEALSWNWRWLPLQPHGGESSVAVGRHFHGSIFEAWLPTHQRACISRKAMEISWTKRGEAVTLLATGTNPLLVDGSLVNKGSSAALGLGSEITFTYEMKVLLRLRFMAYADSAFTPQWSEQCCHHVSQLVRHVPVLSGVSSVSEAIERLTNGTSKCPEGLCQVPAFQGAHLLFRKDCQESWPVSRKNAWRPASQRI